MGKRFAHFRDCYRDAQHHAGVSVIVLLLTAYSILTTYGPLFADYPKVEFYIAAIPKLPIGWVPLIVLLGLLFICFEGGYRLRRADAEASTKRITEMGERFTNEIAEVRQELANERSVRNAPILALELREKRIMLINKSDDKDAYNVALRPVVTGSGCRLESRSLPLVKRGVTMWYSIDAQCGDEWSAWDSDPRFLDPFPPNSIEAEYALFLEFRDYTGRPTYVAEFSMVFNRIKGTELVPKGLSVL
jgi:hypothetical protein